MSANAGPQQIAPMNALRNRAQPSRYATVETRSCSCIYVVQSTTSEILIYRRRTHLINRHPAQDIVGPDTGLNNPSAIAIDSSGRIYVTNYGSDTITVYASNATGDAKPIATLGGPETGISTPTGIALNAKGNIWVSDQIPSGNSTILEFAAGASGDVAPLVTIGGLTTRLHETSGVALDAAGEIITMNFQSPDGSNEGYVEVFAPQAQGDTAPIRSIQGSNTGMIGNAGIAADRKGDVYVPVAGYNVLLVFAAGANGNVPPSQAIGGGNTQLFIPLGIAVDRKDTIFAINQATGGGSGIMGVTVYPAGATGNVSPIQMITGSHTKFHWPNAIAVD